jgi:hypothetical protein
MRDKSGGKAIAAGGFGCVFRPALKCKGKAREPGISKVLIKKYALSEMNEIQKVSNILTRIPNYTDYFVGIGSTSICELEKLTDADRDGFDTKCSNLTDIGINSTNINSNLNKLRSIDSPYGGLEPDGFLKSKQFTLDNFTKLNTSLINLLNNGVVPMNKLGLFHLDLKGPNILIGDDYKSRIIDWGLSGIQTNSGVIPNAAKDRPFMYNAPFCVCLFQNEFKPFLKNKINNIVKTLGVPISSLIEIKEDIRLGMNEWVLKFINLGYKGHYDYIQTVLLNEILIDYANYPKQNDVFTSKTYLTNFIINALTEIVINYTTLTGDFRDIDYFNNVYKHNVDVWGVLSTYYDILTLCRSKITSNKLTNQENAILSHNIVSLMHKYLFNPNQQIEPIDIKSLTRDLKILNTISGYPLTPSPVIAISPVLSAPYAPLSPQSRRSSRVSLRRSKTPSIPALRPVPKKTRKRHVTCDDEKKVKCVARGKVCNEATGRCLAKKK